MRAKFEALQARFRAACAAVSDLRFSLNRKYGNWQIAPAGQRGRLDALRGRQDKAMEAVFAWLDEHSPRRWRTGVPCYWVCEELTYEDAVSTGRLSVVPPVCFGGTHSDAVRFSAPLAQAVA